MSWQKSVREALKTLQTKTVTIEPRASYMGLIDEALKEIERITEGVLGGEEINWVDHFGEAHNVPSDNMVARNGLHTEILQRIREDKE